ncbi:type II toxin-antitoxin system RelE/ParE family toxin [Gracilimonas sediminicola]|uniref:type II toxin-antitoxin system RelE/ParE family toxin n=1 Tax=Gracilimonas sediminicola TaxID=2952158 RepID=UPI003D7A0747
MDYDFEILWSEKALNDLDRILEYLETQWTLTEVQNFKKILFQRIGLIGKYPKLFRPSKIKPYLRRSVLSKQTSIYYQVDKHKPRITIVRLFDNRMDIRKL